MVLVGRDPAHRYSLHRGYADALWAVGATPLVLTPPPDDPEGRHLEAVLSADAVLVAGGGDIDPARYGQPATGGLMDVDPVRDRVELAAVRGAAEAGVPVLGICRGAQLLAVALGGTLHQDLVSVGFASHWAEERQHQPVHAVSAEPGSVAARLLHTAGRVNSIHHQAVRQPGPDLEATAWSPDGVIEAVEADGVLDVQWHPERLFQTDDRHLAPFRWLVAA